MRATRFAALLATVAGSLALAAPAAASTFVVNSTFDLVDLAPGNGVCVTSGGTCTLRAAIQEANALAGADTIELPVGVVELSIAGAGEDAAATGDLDILGETTIQGPALDDYGYPRAAVDANGLDRVFDLRTPSGPVIFRRLYLTGGDVVGPGARGGGLRVQGPVSFWFEDSEISSNFLEPREDDSGYGIALEIFNATVTLLRSWIWDNHEFPAMPTSASTIAASGGSLGVYYSAIGDNGGAGIASSGNLVLFESWIGEQEGRGLNQYGEASIGRSTFYANEGGGILSGVSGALTTLVNSTITENSSLFSGGGIYAGLGTLYLYNSTVVGNVADADANGSGDGGGIYVSASASVHLANTILAENWDLSSPGNVHRDCSGTLTSEGYNLVQYGTGCTIAGDTTGNINGAVPRIADLADNGGTVPTHALLADSPALDAGDPAGCTQVGGTGVVVDQRGYPRPIDGDQEPGAYCDIGAFERDHRTIFREGFECGGFLAWSVVAGRG